MFTWSEGAGSVPRRQKPPDHLAGEDPDLTSECSGKGRLTWRQLIRQRGQVSG